MKVKLANHDSTANDPSTRKGWTWTPEQTAVFEHFANPYAGHLVVRARAGTGKTTVILEAVGRAEWARSVVLCAFNKRIAEELKVKCRDPRAEVKTLHSIGFSFLRPLGKLTVEPGREFGLAKSLVPWEDAGTVASLAVKIKEINHAATVRDAEDLAWRFDCLPASESKLSVADVATYALKVCELSQRNDGTVSFADMLYLPLVLGLARPTWTLVCVDEAQDMSPSQIELVKRIVKVDGRVVVVGDDRQAIYGFRGADENTVDNLKSELGADELGLTVTHRCPKRIVALAQQLVPDYTAADCAPEGEITTVTARQLIEQAQPGDFILSRKNAPLMGVCLALLKSGKRAKIQGKDIGKRLSGIVKKLRPNSIPDLVGKLSTWRSKEIARARARGNGVGTDRETEVNDTADTLLALAEDVTGLQELNAKLFNLFDEAAKSDVDGSGQIVCSSVHKAKGLEASRVFVLRSTLYPGGRETQEEKNIHYVAVTRTKRDLVWVSGNDEM